MYTVAGASIWPGRMTKRLWSVALRTTRVPGTAGVSEIAPAVDGASIGAENDTARCASTATSALRSAGVLVATSGAGAVVMSQWWSRSLRSPWGSAKPPARVNVYRVAGRNTAPRWTSSKPGCGSSQWIQHGAVEPAVKTVLKSQPGIGGLTDLRAGRGRASP